MLCDACVGRSLGAGNSGIRGKLGKAGCSRLPTMGVLLEEGTPFLLKQSHPRGWCWFSLQDPPVSGRYRTQQVSTLWTFIISCDRKLWPSCRAGRSHGSDVSSGTQVLFVSVLPTLTLDLSLGCSQDGVSGSRHHIQVTRCRGSRQTIVPIGSFQSEETFLRSPLADLAFHVIGQNWVTCPFLNQSLWRNGIS